MSLYWNAKPQDEPCKHCINPGMGPGKISSIGSAKGCPIIEQQAWFRREIQLNKMDKVRVTGPLEAWQRRLMSKSTELAATVLVLIRAERPDIHTTAPINSTYNQKLAPAGPAKRLHCCFSAGGVFSHCLSASLIYKTLLYVVDTGWIIATSCMKSQKYNTNSTSVCLSQCKVCDFRFLTGLVTARNEGINH